MISAPDILLTRHDMLYDARIEERTDAGYRKLVSKAEEAVLDKAEIAPPKGCLRHQITRRRRDLY